jgi:hypothetical protein
MRIRYHIAKAQRIERALGKLSVVDDYEMVIESCMLAATHYFNAAMHAAGITHEMQDQAHTSRPPLDFLRKSLTPEIKKGADALAYIENTRKHHVRGGAPYERDVVANCVKSLDDARMIFLTVVGPARNKVAWEQVTPGEAK